jgi:hypothetical protein
MATDFDNWLRELAQAGKGGSALSSVDIPAAVRGEAWAWPIFLEGNWTSATMEATIRSAPDAASVLATVSIGSASYDSGTGFTSWAGSLAAGTGSNSTGSLPVDTDGSGEEKFPLALYMTPSGGTKMMILGGAFTLLGKV